MLLFLKVQTDVEIILKLNLCQKHVIMIQGVSPSFTNFLSSYSDSWRGFIKSQYACDRLLSITLDQTALVIRCATENNVVVVVVECEGKRLN